MLKAQRPDAGSLSECMKSGVESGAGVEAIARVGRFISMFLFYGFPLVSSLSSDSYGFLFALVSSAGLESDRLSKAGRSPAARQKGPR